MVDGDYHPLSLSLSSLSLYIFSLSGGGSRELAGSGEVCWEEIFLCFIFVFL